MRKGERRKGFRTTLRRGRTVYVIDFWYIDPTGVWRRYRRDADIQTAASARSEAERRRKLAWEMGSPDGVEETPEKKAPPTLDAFWLIFSETYLATNYTPATAERYRALYKQLSKEFGSKRLDEITLLAWKRFEASLARRTRRRARGEVIVGVKARPFAALMRTFFNKAVELELIEAADVPVIPLPRKPGKLPSAPEYEDLAAWLAVLPHTWIRLAVALAAFLGLRMGEVRALRRVDFDLRNSVVTIRRAMSANTVSTTKGKKERAVPLHPSLAAIVTPVLEKLKADELVVRNRAGKQPSRQAVLTAFKALCAKARTKTWSFHSIRHMFVTTLLQRGVSTIAVQELAGHESLKTTELYVHGAKAAQRREAILLLPPVVAAIGTERAMGNGEETAPAAPTRSEPTTR